MGNNGLKNKNEIIQKVVGNTEVLCNVSKYHGNVSLKINLLSTIGAKQTDFFLYYNEYDSSNVGFGTGVTCNFYNRLDYSNNQVIMTTFDGLQYTFDYVGSSKYYCTELNQTIEENSNHFCLYDGFGNEYHYPSTGNYPSHIIFGQSGYSLVFSISTYKLTKIEVKSGTRVISAINITYTVINSVYYATTITCTKPNNTYNISYSSGKISAITSIITGETDLITNMSYTYNQYEIIVLDNIARRRCKIYYGPNTHYQTYDIDKIEEDYYINNSSVDKITTFVSQGNGYVKIYDNYNNTEYLYYEKGNIGYILDLDKRIKKCAYNNYNYLLGIYSPVEIDYSSTYSYNLIKNGYFESSIPYENWSINYAIDYDIIPDPSRPLSSMLGENYLKIKEVGFRCYIEQTIEKRGSELDNYTLVLWVREFSLGEEAETPDFEIELVYNSTIYGIETISYTYQKQLPHKESLTGAWYPIILDVSKNKNFDSLRFRITLLNPGLELGLDGILLINSKVKNEASYYAFSRKEKEEENEDVINYIHNYHDSYNNIDKLGMIIDNDGRVTKYTYDNDCYNVIKEESSNLTITKTYDTIEKNNLLKEEVESNSKKLITEYTYTNSKDFFQTIKDYDDSITTYYTDESRGNITNTTYKNGLNMLSAYDTKDNYEVREISGSNFLKELYYTYENFGSFNEIKMNNSYKYDFDYVNNKLSQIKVNNLVLENITYKSTYPYAIEEITKGVNGDKVKFEYNLDGTLANVYYKLKGETSYNLKYRYVYNEKRLVRSQVFSGSSDYSLDYQYDKTGKLVKICDSYNSNRYSEYLYDEAYLFLKNINTLSRKRIELINSTNKEMRATKNDLRISALYQTGEEGKYYTFFDEGTNVTFLRLYSSTNKAYGITKLIENYNSFNIYESNDNKYISLTSSSSILKYLIPSEYYGANSSLNVGSFGFLFIPSSLSNVKTLFSIFDDNGSSRIIISNNSSNEVVLQIYDINGELNTTHYFYKKCNLNALNYFGISYSINASTIKIRCVFNNEKYDFDQDSLYDIIVLNHFSIGSYKNDTSSKSTFNVYSIMAMPITSGEPLSLSELIKNYHLLKDVYETPSSATNRTGMDTVTSSIITNLTDFIPLTNSFRSINNKKPVHLNYRYDEECIRNKYFRYIDSVKTYMLKLDGINLVYDLDLGNTFTIGMNIIFNNIYNTDYIYKVMDNSKSIGILIKDNYLYIDYNNNLTNTNISVVPNTLYFISLGLDYVIPSDSLFPTYYKIRVVCNDSHYENTITSDKLNDKLLIIGSKGMNEEVDHFMDGYVSSLCYKNTYMSVNSLNNLRNELNPLKTESVIDGLGRIEKSIIKEGSFILEKTLDYIQVEDTPSTNKDTTFISNEIVKNRNHTTLYQRSYEYGTNYSYGNITKIKENNSLVNQYYYNEKGYLITSYDINYGKNENFEYDDNGNITRKLIRSNIDGTIYDDISFYYDTTWPDRLVEYNGKRIDYDTDSIGCPHHYGIFVNGIFTSGITYSWRCSKLIGLNDSINNKTISYDYDEEGKRIRKTVNNVSHYYYYEGNRLLVETYGNNRLDFLYDESGSVIGFDYTSNNSTNRYYYIKNISGDIIKIVDNSSTIVVSYLYSSYGEVLSISGTLASTIGIINPFRYRSYYYDIDTSMYYLKTRYYNPEWGRFISSDNISYLEYDNPLGVNLFSYCNNNPIMYDDPEGTFGWLVLLMIGVVFVCVNCSGHDGYINANIELNYYENDADIDNQKINYKISKNDDEDVVIHIEESYKITNRSIKEKILKEIINSEQGQSFNLSESDINYYIQEWASHNIVYRYSPILSLFMNKTTKELEEQTGNVDLNKGDKHARHYRLLGDIYEIFF